VNDLEKSINFIEFNIVIMQNSVRCIDFSGDIMKNHFIESDMCKTMECIGVSDDIMKMIEKLNLFEK